MTDTNKTIAECEAKPSLSQKCERLADAITLNHREGCRCYYCRSALYLRALPALLRERQLYTEYAPGTPGLARKMVKATREVEQALAALPEIE